jgi:hypothetical protein
MPVIQYGSTNLNALIHPDLYVNIIPPTVLAINGIPTNILGIVGLASWGPKSAPMTISNMSDYVQTFGPILPVKHDMGSAVYNAYINGANNMRCVRITDGTDAAATASVMDSEVTPVLGMTLTALYTGTVGNSIIATMSAGSNTTLAAPTFKMTIALPSTPVPEVYDNIGGTGLAFWTNMVAAINTGIPNVRSKSKIVSAVVGTATSSPALVSSPFTGGLNGNTSPTSANFLGTDGVTRTGLYSLRGSGCGVAMICDMDDSTTWTNQTAYGLSEGTYMILTTISGQYNSITAMVALKQGAGINSYDAKIMLGDWCYFNDTTNGLTRLISPQSFIAGRIANLSPEQSSLNKSIAGIISTEGQTSGKIYSGADLDTLTTAGIDVIVNPSPGGNYFSARIGCNTSNNNLISDDSYTRMTNYLAYTLNSAMGIFIGQTQTMLSSDTTRASVKATISGFLQELLKNNMIQAYQVVCDLTNNSPMSIAADYLYCDVNVQYMNIVKKFIINLNGSGLSITSQTVG